MSSSQGGEARLSSSLSSIGRPTVRSRATSPEQSCSFHTSGYAAAGPVHLCGVGQGLPGDRLSVSVSQCPSLDDTPPQQVRMRVCMSDDSRSVDALQRRGRSVNEAAWKVVHVPPNK